MLKIFRNTLVESMLNVNFGRFRLDNLKTVYAGHKKCMPHTLSKPLIISRIYTKVLDVCLFQEKDR